MYLPRNGIIFEFADDAADKDQAAVVASQCRWNCLGATVFPTSILK